MAGKMWFSFITWPRFSGFVDSNNPELVPLALAETGHPCLQLVDGGHAVVIVRDQSVKPASKLVLLLDDKMGDWPSSVISRFVPSQCYTFVVKINNSRLSGLSWWFCNFF